MRTFVLVNRLSGGKAGDRVLREARALCDRGAFEGTVEALDIDDFDTQLRRAIQSEILIIAGGDGTVSRAIAKIISEPFASAANPALSIGLIPLGTGNDLAREFRVPEILGRLGFESLLAAYRTARKCPLDIWSARLADGTCLPFCNYLSLGFDGAVVNSFHKTRFRRRAPFFRGAFGNRVSYAAASTRHFRYRLSLSDVCITADGRELVCVTRCKSLIASNIRAVMGIGMMNAVGDFKDGRCELTITTSARDYVRMIASTFAPIRPLSPLGSFSTIEIEGLPPDVPIQVDGEPMIIPGTGRISISRIGVVSMLIPESALTAG